jgi:hypothetical protein
MAQYSHSGWELPSSSENINPEYVTAGEPQVAMNNDGDAIIVWRQRGSTGVNEIFMSEYRNGIWTHPADTDDFLSMETACSGSNPKVAMSDYGNAIILYQECSSIFMKEYRDGEWHEPVVISQTAFNKPGMDLAMDDNGNAIIAWSEDDMLFMSELR